MLAVILGTRPELIKCAPVILEAQRRGVPVGIIHTGQHYTPELDDIFFTELNLPKPIAHVHVGSHAAARQLGLMMERLSDVLAELKPAAVMVQGDTNSVLAGALAAYKSGVPVAHLEAGLRSDDWDMPEESNRVLADRISKWLFAPTEHQRERLAGEGITHSGVHVVGNTIVDASLYYSKVAYEKSDIAERLKLTGRPYALLTMHRPSNVDEEARLRAMINAIGEAAKRLGMTVVFPVHPRTRAMLDQHRIAHDNIIETAPIGYLDLLRLQAASDLVLTDSGGMQEEACILRVPTVTLRANTERPETLRVGSNVLHHEADVDLLHAVMQAQRAKVRDWENPFGDGRTAIKVLDIMIRDVPSLDSRPKTE